EKGIDLNAYLENNDSYTFFTEVGGVIKTGYTGTNVMDLTIIIIGGKE
ncbi:MAG: glycerate dehydrogenase, partial [Aquificae bacterium]|nr:glycerate dehydrogenase [Aquificota bacterium]